MRQQRSSVGSLGGFPGHYSRLPSKASALWKALAITSAGPQGEGLPGVHEQVCPRPHCQCSGCVVLSALRPLWLVLPPLCPCTVLSHTPPDSARLRVPSALPPLCPQGPALLCGQAGGTGLLFSPFLLTKHFCSQIFVKMAPQIC